MIWKMHDRVIDIATFSPPVVSCAIRSTSAQDLWTPLKDKFYIVNHASIFQMKSEWQNITKVNDSISLYLQMIKEAHDDLYVAGVYFDDDDVVIITLNSLSAEYNTIRSIIREKENVISINDLRSQLLTEEAILDNALATSFLSTMEARNNGSNYKASKLASYSNYGNQSTASSLRGSSY